MMGRRFLLTTIFCALFSIGITQTLIVPISAGNGDAEEQPNGTVNLADDELELTDGNTNEFQLIGLHFENITIPQGATISSALIQFTHTTGNNTNTAEFLIYGEDHFNPTAFNSTIGNISDRPRTQQMLSWVPPDWNGINTATPAEATPDLSLLIQEIIDIPGWQSGNAINLFIAGRGYREAHSFEGGGGFAPVLEINYSVPVAGTNFPPQVDIVFPRDSFLQTNLQPINFQASTTDTTGWVQTVEFLVNGLSVGTDAVYPFEWQWTPTGMDTFHVQAVATDDSGLKDTSAVRHVLIDTSLFVATTIVPIIQNNADAEQLETGFMSLTSSDLEIIRDESGSAKDQLIGLRFEDLPLPQGVTIVEAYIEFTVDEDDNHHPADLLIYAHDHDDAPTINGSFNNLSNRFSTNETVLWQPRLWTQVGQSGADQRTPDLRYIIQEIVDRPGWEEENEIVFLISGIGRRIAYSFEGNLSFAPRLVLSYLSTAEIIRGPYLQKAGTDRMTIRYRTNAEIPTEIAFGSSMGNLNQTITDPTPKTEHEIEITGLNPASSYFYEIRFNGNPILAEAPDLSFTTLPLAGSRPLIRTWILGDPGTANNNARAVRNAYYGYAGQNATDAIIMLGDNAYNSGTDVEYQNAVFENMYEDLLKNTVLFPCPGNHEFSNGYTNSNTETGPYYDIFSLPTNGESGGLPSGTEAYYSFDIGNVHFISMDSHDSDRSPGGAMATWLINDLATTTQEWIVAFFHHPPYTKGSHNSDNPGDSGGRLDDMRENFLPILENAGVDLVLCGHSHSYERSYLLNGHYGYSNTLTQGMILDGGDGKENGDGAYQKNYQAGQSNDGTVYITAGSSGKITGGPLNHPVMYASFNTLGSCVMEVDSNRLEIKFLTSTGAITDNFVMEKEFYFGHPPVVSISSPVDGAVYAQVPPVNLTIEADATDSDGQIVEVEFFVNGSSIGVDNSAPWEMPATFNANGNYWIKAIALDDSANIGRSDSIEIWVGPIEDSIEVSIANDNEDVEERKTGIMDITSSDLEFAEDNNHGYQIVGMRFQSIDIPKGAQITNAYLQFKADESVNINPSEIVFWGEDHYDAAAALGTIGNLSSRRRTQNTVNWNISNWNVVGQQGPAQRSPDLSAIIQEIVELPGWESGNALFLMATGWGRRVAESINGDASGAPRLKVEYIWSPAGPNTPPTVKILTPRDSIQYNGLETVYVGTQTQDAEFNQTQVSFLLDGVGVGADLTYPFENTFTVPNVAGWHALVATVSDEGGESHSDTIHFFVNNSVSLDTVVYSINTGNNDGEEDKNGSISLNGQVLSMSRTADYNAGERLIALRFEGLNLSQGQEIYGAWLQFTAQSGIENYHPIELEIRAEATDDSPPLATANSNFSNRATTSDSVLWRPPVWVSVNESQAAQKSPDLQFVLKEIINRPGWQSGQAITFLIKGSGGRPAWSYNGSAAMAARLEIRTNVPTNISRGPYLQIGSDTSIVVRYRTAEPISSKVVYGNSPSNLNQSVQQGGATTEHEVFIGGLTPNTQYFYAIQSGADFISPPDSAHYFITAPPSGTVQPMRAWILGDCGTGNANARSVRDAYYGYTGAAHTDMMIMLGDNAYNQGTDNQYQFAVFENMYEEMLQKTVLWPSPGNHEFFNGATDSDNETGPYYDIFSMPRNGEAGGIPSGTEAYYSYDYGNAHFISLDSYDTDRSPGSPMLNWLTNDLASTTQEWIIVYFHHPPYSKGSHDSDNIFDSGGRMQDMRENVLPILEAAGVDLVLSGHSHSYERSFLVHQHYGFSPSLTDEMVLDKSSGSEGLDYAYSKQSTGPHAGNGAVYITAGSSGKISNGNLNHPLMYASFSVLGSCVLDIDDNRLDLNFLTNTGAVLDNFTIVKGEKPAVRLIEPKVGRQMAVNQSTDIIAYPEDPDGQIVKVSFYVNDTPIGTDSDSVFSISWTPTAAGVYALKAIATDDDGLTCESEPIYVWVGNQFSTCIPLEWKADDGTENSLGEINLHEDNLRLGQDLVALRFEKLGLPPKAHITSASIRFVSGSTSSTSSNVQIRTNTTLLPGPFVGDANDLSNRMKSSDFVNWDIDPWTTAGVYNSPDLSNLILDYIQTPGYELGDAIHFFLEGNGNRQARSFDFDPSLAPVLCIDYSLDSLCRPIDSLEHLVHWYRADEGVLDASGNPAGSGAKVQFWENQIITGGGISQTNPSDQPSYAAALLKGDFNAHAHIEFEGSEALVLPNAISEESFHIFVVQESYTAFSPMIILGGQRDANQAALSLHKENDLYRWRLGSVGNTIALNGGTGGNAQYNLLEFTFENGQMKSYIDGNSAGTKTYNPLGSPEGLLSNLVIGMDPNGEYDDYEGDFGEILVFSKVLNPVERQQLLTYMNIRFATPIDADDHLYFDFAGQSVGLNGIGADPLMGCLDQVSSKSVLNESRMRLCATVALDSGDFMVQGHDGKGLFLSNQVPSGFDGRLKRLWRVSVMGDPGKVDVEFDAAGLGYDMSTPGIYFLLKDNNNNFTDAVIANPEVAIVDGDYVIFKNVDFSHGDFFTIGQRNGIRVQLGAYLQGAYESLSGLMRDQLRVSGLLPATEPYTAHPAFTHADFGGGEQLSPDILNITGSDAIVDWVFVELRDALDSTQVVATRSALIQRDGDIVDMNGNADLLFPAMNPGDYYIALRHRNHLGVMSQAPLSLSFISTTLDFRDSTTQVFGTHAQVLLPGSPNMAMWGGDANSDGRVIFQSLFNDPNPIFLYVLTDPANTAFARNFVSQGYRTEDVNLDGQIIFQGGSSDTGPIFLNILAYPLNAAFSRNFVIVQQLP